MLILLVASHGAAAATSISSIIDCGWMVVLVYERMRVRRDSYFGLNGLVSCQGVNFPGTLLSRSLSKVFGNVSGQSSRIGWFSGRISRRVA